MAIVDNSVQTLTQSYSVLNLCKKLFFNYMQQIFHQRIQARALKHKNLFLFLTLGIILSCIRSTIIIEKVLLLDISHSFQICMMHVLIPFFFKKCI